MSELQRISSTAVYAVLSTSQQAVRSFARSVSPAGLANEQRIGQGVSLWECERLSLLSLPAELLIGFDGNDDADLCSLALDSASQLIADLPGALRGVIVLWPADELAVVPSGRGERGASMISGLMSRSGRAASALDALARAAEVDLPVTWVLWDVDRLPGMVDLARLLPVEQRRQALGWTRASRMQADVLSGFEELGNRILQAVLRSARPLSTSTQLALLATLPGTIAMVRSGLMYLLEALAPKPSGSQKCFLEGIYLASGRQDETMAEPLLAALAGTPIRQQESGGDGAGEPLFVADLVEHHLLAPRPTFDAAKPDTVQASSGAVGRWATLGVSIAAAVLLGAAVLSLSLSEPLGAEPLAVGQAARAALARAELEPAELSGLFVRIEAARSTLDNPSAPAGLLVADGPRSAASGQLARAEQALLLRHLWQPMLRQIQTQLSTPAVYTPGRTADDRLAMEDRQALLVAYLELLRPAPTGESSLPSFERLSELSVRLARLSGGSTTGASVRAEMQPAWDAWRQAAGAANVWVDAAGARRILPVAIESIAAFHRPFTRVETSPNPALARFTALREQARALLARHELLLVQIQQAADAPAGSRNEQQRRALVLQIGLPTKPPDSWLYHVDQFQRALGAANLSYAAGVDAGRLVNEDRQRFTEQFNALRRAYLGGSSREDWASEAIARALAELHALAEGATAGNQDLLAGLEALIQTGQPRLAMSPALLNVQTDLIQFGQQALTPQNQTLAPPAEDWSTWASYLAGGGRFVPASLAASSDWTAAQRAQLRPEALARLSELVGSDDPSQAAQLAEALRALVTREPSSPAGLGRFRPASSRATGGLLAGMDPLAADPFALREAALAVAQVEQRLGPAPTPAQRALRDALQAELARYAAWSVDLWGRALLVERAWPTLGPSDAAALLADDADLPARLGEFARFAEQVLLADQALAPAARPALARAIDQALAALPQRVAQPLIALRATSPEETQRLAGQFNAAIAQLRQLAQRLAAFDLAEGPDLQASAADLAALTGVLRPQGLLALPAFAQMAPSELAFARGVHELLDRAFASLLDRHGMASGTKFPMLDSAVRDQLRAQLAGKLGGPASLSVPLPDAESFAALLSDVRRFRTRTAGVALPGGLSAARQPAMEALEAWASWLEALSRSTARVSIRYQPGDEPNNLRIAYSKVRLSGPFQQGPLVISAQGQPGAAEQPLQTGSGGYWSVELLEPLPLFANVGPVELVRIAPERQPAANEAALWCLAVLLDLAGREQVAQRGADGSRLYRVDLRADLRGWAGEKVPAAVQTEVALRLDIRLPAALPGTLPPPRGPVAP